MSLDSIFKINGSALNAQMMRMEVLSSNIANVNVTRSPQGTPYRRKDVIFESFNVGDGFEESFINAQNTGTGVKVTQVIEDRAPFRKKFQPHHPDANPQGYVLYPNINVISEMVNIQEAARAYEANISVILSTKNMIAKTFEIGG